MYKILCSTGALLGKPNGRGILILPDSFSLSIRLDMKGLLR